MNGPTLGDGFGSNNPMGKGRDPRREHDDASDEEDCNRDDINESRLVGGDKPTSTRSGSLPLESAAGAKRRLELKLPSWRQSASQ
jgi:hypothetical protein